MPGVGIQSLELGENLPEKWPAQLGNPDIVFPFHDTGEGLRRIVWGSMSKGQLSKGIALMAQGQGETSVINEIVIRGIRAGVDKENLFLGLPEENVSKRSESVQKDGKKSYLLPGLTIESANGKLETLKVHSPHSTRWRFKQWSIRPGQAAGPIKLGQKVDESVFQSIGEPHQRSETRLLWQAEDSNQTLKIDLEERTGTVTRVHAKGLHWRTPNGVTLGDSEAAFSAKHPEARSGQGRAYEDTLLKMPGLRATFSKGKLISFDVYPIRSDL